MASDAGLTEEGSRVAGDQGTEGRTRGGAPATPDPAPEYGAGGIPPALIMVWLGVLLWSALAWITGGGVAGGGH